MPCLDTDFLVGLLRGNKDAIKKLRLLSEKAEPLHVTPITISELFEGAYLSGAEQNIAETEEILRPLTMLEYDWQAAKDAGFLLGELNKKGSKIGDLDT